VEDVCHRKEASIEEEARNRTFDSQSTAAAGSAGTSSRKGSSLPADQSRLLEDKAYRRSQEESAATDLPSKNEPGLATSDKR
jgi:hypothetical protein